MTTYISILRGVNVGPSKRIKMDELKKSISRLNLESVKTYIQSGNVVFNSDNSDSSFLKEKIEDEIRSSFGFDVTVIIRTKEQLETLIKNSPFKDEDTNHVYITFLSELPNENLIEDLKIDDIKNKSDKIFFSPKEIYLFLPGGYGRTKLNNNYFEKKLGTSATTRNWKTVNKLMDIADSIKEK